MNASYWPNANFTLACAFPPRNGLNGACTTIADLGHGHRPDPIFCPTKRSAVRLIVAANMAWACAYGHGNKAAKRAAACIEGTNLYVSTLNRSFELKRRTRAQDAISEAHAEGRLLPAGRTNIHE